MNGNYEISSVMVPLKTLCAIKVAQQFIVANRIHLIENEFEEKEAIKRVRNMELPRDVIELVENIIEPIALELFEWNKLSEGYGDPVWTSLGTVDLFQSAKLIVPNKNVDKMVRYKLACRCCFEEWIFEIFTEFNNDPDYDWQWTGMEIGPSLVRFWTNAIMGKFGESVGRGRLTQHACHNGFIIACQLKNDIAIKYFISETSPKDELINQSQIYHLNSPLLPATCCLIFTKLSHNAQEEHISIYYCHLLIALLKWPYQSFFLEALHSVGTRLDQFIYCEIINQLINFISYDNRDYNYRKLFTSLWPMRCNYYWKGPFDFLYWTVLKAVLSKDEGLIKFLFDSMSETEEDMLLERCILGNFKPGLAFLPIFDPNRIINFCSLKSIYRYPPANGRPFPEWAKGAEIILSAGLQQFAKIVNFRIAAKRMPNEFDPSFVFNIAGFTS